MRASNAPSDVIMDDPPWSDTEDNQKKNIEFMKRAKCQSSNQPSFKSTKAICGEGEGLSFKQSHREQLDLFGGGDSNR